MMATFMGGVCQAQSPFEVLDDSLITHYTEVFNAQDPETVVNLVSNAESADWLSANIPRFACPDSTLESIYYFRWWSFRKHLKQTPHGYLFTEFILPVKHDGAFNSISCALGHQIYEGRWLHQPEYIKQYVDFWLDYEQHQPGSKFHNFSNWLSDAVYQWYLVNGDDRFLIGRLPALDADFKRWEDERLLPSGLFWQHDVKDGMEESVSGGRRVQNARPTINSYMYGNAVALSKIASKGGDGQLAEHYARRAADIKELVETQLWDDTAKFYKTKLAEDGSLAPREAIGFIPWYFNLPDDSRNHARAWSQLVDTLGFKAPWGLTTAERREPTFRTRGSGDGCEWDGAIWPFATTQTLKGLANLLSGYDNVGEMDKAAYYDALHTYAWSHQKNGRPYIGEYQDEKTGYWLKGDSPRSEFYNHSGFCDLIINDLIGVKPQEDANSLKIHPLVPEGKWDWFCLDGVAYRGQSVTVLWDKTGKKYNRGKGLMVFVDGQQVAKSKRLKPLDVNW